VLGGTGASVDIWNRTSVRAETVRVEVSKRALEIEVELKVSTIPPEIPTDAVSGLDQGSYDLIVNTTAVGLYGEDPFAHLPLRPDGFRPGQVVVDMVYSDTPSLLLAAATAGGATTVDGIEVLVQQGARSLRLWTHLDPPLDVMRAAAYSLGDR
jgi:shikimate 5-dehydrogenase